MFHKLRLAIDRMLGKQEAKPQTFDLTTVDIASLNELIHTDEWQAYLNMIDHVVAYRAEAMLTTNDTNSLHFLRGQLAAMRELPMLVERMAKGQRDAAGRNRDIAGERTINRAARRTGALYSTPSWPT